MSSNPKPIKCACCNVVLEPRAKPDPQVVLFCPQCGISDTLENVQREAAEFAMEHMQKQFSLIAENAFRGTKNVELTGDVIPERAHRFVIDMD